MVSSVLIKNPITELVMTSAQSIQADGLILP
jgi:hypothetical protein